METCRRSCPLRSQARVSGTAEMPLARGLHTDVPGCWDPAAQVLPRQVPPAARPQRFLADPTMAPPAWVPAGGAAIGGAAVRSTQNQGSRQQKCLPSLFWRLKSNIKTSGGGGGAPATSPGQNLPSPPPAPGAASLPGAPQLTDASPDPCVRPSTAPSLGLLPLL